MTTKRDRRLVIVLSRKEWDDMREFADRKGVTKVQDWARMILLHELTIGEWVEASALDTPVEDEPVGRSVAKTWPPKEEPP